jgi:hypothetical protein
MRFPGPLRVFIGILLLAIGAAADDAPAVPPIPANAPAMTRQTRMQMIRLLNAEFAFTHLPLPRGEKGLILKPNGQILPAGQELHMLLAKQGQAARAGDRVQITNIDIKDKSVFFEFNGGGIHKKKWYQRIEISGSGGSTPIADQPDQLAKGSSLLVEFKSHVPEMTLAQFKEILKPILDFTVKSAAQAYTETLPENVRNAIRDHQVLVGMDKEMVTYAMGRPPQRIREKDPDTNEEYEEWIYGTPPQDVDFVKFQGEEVVRLKIMKVGEAAIIRTAKEVHLEQQPGNAGGAAAPAVAAAPDQTPADPTRKAPSLRRPGETPPDNGQDQPQARVPPPPTSTPDPSNPR